VLAIVIVRGVQNYIAINTTHCNSRTGHQGINSGFNTNVQISNEFYNSKYMLKVDKTLSAWVSAIVLRHLDNNRGLQPAAAV